MSTMKITVIGLDAYANSHDKSIFDSMQLPSDIDKEAVTDDILLNAGEFEVLYPDLEFFTQAVGIWSKRYYRTFEKWAKALNTDYNPLENYDRTEEWTDNSSSSGTTSGKTEGNDSSTNSHDVSAYDSSTYSNDDRNTNTANSRADTESRADGSTDSIHSGRTHGNIGVTTSQQMLQAEMDLKLSLYKQITDLFIQELCIAVY